MASHQGYGKGVGDLGWRLVRGLAAFFCLSIGNAEHLGYGLELHPIEHAVLVAVKPPRARR